MSALTTTRLADIAAAYELSREPLTVQMLKSLRPGQRLTYYRGDLDRDIEGSAHGGRLEAYQTILKQIRSAADHLAARGRIKLTKVKITTSRDHTYFSYAAEGI